MKKSWDERLQEVTKNADTTMWAVLERSAGNARNEKVFQEALATIPTDPPGLREALEKTLHPDLTKRARNGKEAAELFLAA